MLPQGTRPAASPRVTRTPTCRPSASDGQPDRDRTEAAGDRTALGPRPHGAPVAGVDRTGDRPGRRGRSPRLRRGADARPTLPIPAPGDPGHRAAACRTRTRPGSRSSRRGRPPRPAAAARPIGAPSLSPFAGRNRVGSLAGGSPHRRSTTPANSSAKPGYSVRASPPSVIRLPPPSPGAIRAQTRRRLPDSETISPTSNATAPKSTICSPGSCRIDTVIHCLVPRNSTVDPSGRVQLCPGRSVFVPTLVSSPSAICRLSRS